MDWEWRRPSADSPNENDRFTVRLRRAVRADNGASLGFSLTITDQPYGAAVSKDTAIYQSMDECFSITGPLWYELRAEGWNLMPKDDIGTFLC